MEFKGNQQVRLSPSQIWDILLDPEYIIKLTPEVSAIRVMEADHYAVSTHIKVGFIKKRFAGHIKVDRIEPDRIFRMDLLQKSSIGSVEGFCQVELELCQTYTELNYWGDLYMDGLVGRVGSPIVKQMINPVIDQFIKRFDEKHYSLCIP